MKATQELKNEHRGIEQMLRVLSAISEKVGRGDPLNAAHMEGVMEFLTIFVDKCHHGKEEEFLFPALEKAGVARDGGPIGVMLDEHEQGRQLVAKLKESGGRYASGDKTAAVSVQHTIDDYVALLTRHIDKENNVLFEMADAKLNADLDAELFEAFERLERERIGLGKHDEFHALLDRLQDNYLK